ARSNRTTVAVLFGKEALGPGYSRLETIRLLRFALPKIRLVACHGFSEAIDWPELSDAGAFHELWLPLQENEVRLCLGFVWEAEKRAAAAKLTDIGAARSLIAISAALETSQRIPPGPSPGLRISTAIRTAR